MNILENRSILKIAGYSLLGLIILLYIVGIFWSSEPDVFEVSDADAYLTSGQNKTFVVGYTTVATTEKVARTLLEKTGGYLSNDITPPSIFLDNIPSWEFGVLVQVRDMASALRNHMSRSQSQSLENQFLKEAEPRFNNDHDMWMFPESESKYREGIELLSKYKQSLAEKDSPENQFYARADNLNAWLLLVEKRLGGLSQRLAASVGQERLNTDLSGDSAAAQSTQSSSSLQVKTPWLEIDNNFYEARGACWALIHMLKAIQIDFKPVLQKKNAEASLAQIIRELESTQEGIWSPVILNGSGFGFVANHSLVMASYISRANAGLIDLRELLAKG
ncbi:DUF2333 family protein [Aliikangiella marina]|uniref:DUF2333 family protein n=1 Tax=Aliikangiella marina TaxID=1712262 RepID=A0A545TH57_9GAMM|nr:DUF2333 family protein [Aliikangiella marina]TQV76528.1 DUF2333 family protein [Aliikangiella marina]